MARHGSPIELVCLAADVCRADVVAHAEHVYALCFHLCADETEDLAVLHHISETECIVDDFAVSDIQGHDDVHAETLAERNRNPSHGTAALFLARAPAVIHALEAVHRVVPAPQGQVSCHVAE